MNQFITLLNYVVFSKITINGNMNNKTKICEINRIIH